MVYPGLPGQVGPRGPLANHKAQQIRQSTAGSYPGGKTYTTVIDAMGSNAPAAAIAAQEVTVLEEVADDPFTIEGENFESGLGGFDASTSSRNRTMTFPATFPFTFWSLPAPRLLLGPFSPPQTLESSGHPPTVA